MMRCKRLSDAKVLNIYHNTCLSITFSFVLGRSRFSF